MNLHTQDHIDDSDLLRFVDRELGELDVEIVEGHIAQCSDCRDRYDDLAAASDSLTAFLNQADYAPRALAYTPARAAGWWNKPLLRAAAVTLLLAGVATPAAILLMDHGAASNEPKGMLVLPPSRAPGEPGATSRSAPPFDVTRAPRPVPTPQPTRSGEVDLGYCEPSDDCYSPLVATFGNAENFVIEIDRWQTRGVLRLVFSDSDVFLYNPGAGSVASIGTRTGTTTTGIMSINTTAGSETDHEIWISEGYGPEDVTVRIAGIEIPFTAEQYTAGQVSLIVGAFPTAVAEISLARPTR